MNLPGSQLAHAAAPLPAATVPGLHGVCVVLPAVAYDPGLVGVHWSAPLRP